MVTLSMQMPAMSLGIIYILVISLRRLSPHLPKSVNAPNADLHIFPVNNQGSWYESDGLTLGYKPAADPYLLSKTVIGDRKVYG